MMFKLLDKCDGCRKKRLYIAKRTVNTPVGKATSQDYFCGKCFPKKAKLVVENTIHNG